MWIRTPPIHSNEDRVEKQLIRIPPIHSNEDRVEKQLIRNLLYTPTRTGVEKQLIRIRIVLGSYPGNNPFSPVGWFFFIKTSFLKWLFIKKKKKLIKKDLENLITFNWFLKIFIIKLYFQLISYLIRDGLYICCLNLFHALLIFISFLKLAFLNFK